MNKVTNQDELVLQLQEENRELRLLSEYLSEQVKLLQVQLYGKKSEKVSLPAHPDQLSYMEELEPKAKEAKKSNPVVEESEKNQPRKRKNSGRKPLPEALPREDVLHDIPDHEKQCACGAELYRFSQECSEQLNFIPARLEVIRHVRPKYVCKSCEGVESDGKAVRIASVPKRILPKSIASPRLLAQIVTAKFVDALPFYRQEKQFSRLGYTLSRANMSNWVLKLGKRIKPLLRLLKKLIHSGPLINMDETTFQVLKEEGRKASSKSYMWVQCGGPSGKPGVYFDYDPSRASGVAEELLRDYEGFVQTDGYAGYEFIKKHAECWAHVRRYFMDVIKVYGEAAMNGRSGRAIKLIRKLYRIEQKMDEKQLSDEERVTERQKKSKPILDKLFKWLTLLKPKTPPEGLLGKAVAYCLNRKDKLMLYLNHGFLSMDNNLAENAIRPFVVGRKNWLFCNTPAGAEASAGFYSLIETAKANGLNPFDYLETLFERLPLAKTEEQLKNLLPQYIEVATSG